MPLNKSRYPYLAKAVSAHVSLARPPWRETAQVLNFLSDDRAPEIGDFFDELEKGFASVKLGVSSFLEAVHPKIRPPISRWLGLLESPLTWNEGYTFLSFRDINNYLVDLPLDSPPPRITLTKPLKFNVITSRPVKRFIWVTDASSLPMSTGKDVVTILGLPHYAYDDVIYRVKLSLTGKKLFVPTALDAEVYEAWCFPHGGDPRSSGLTRHLEDGSLRCNELLTEVSAHTEADLVAELVGALPDASVGPYMLDFLVGRPIRNVAGYMA